MSEVFQGRTFTATDERLRILTDIARRHLAAEGSPRILDLGCGTGGQLCDLAVAYPGASLAGVDVSVENVEVAAGQADELGLAGRARFVTADYLEYEDEPFDLIVSDSVLQNLHVPDAVLYGKIARDLNPGGFLAVNIPYLCLYNRCLWGVRRLARLLPRAVTNGMVLILARMLHPGMDENLLRERMPYMYLLPARADGTAMRRILTGDYGLELIEEQAMPHASLAQPRHRILVYRKAAGP